MEGRAPYADGRSELTAYPMTEVKGSRKGTSTPYLLAACCISLIGSRGRACFGVMGTLKVFLGALQTWIGAASAPVAAMARANAAMSVRMMAGNVVNMLKKKLSVRSTSPGVGRVMQVQKRREREWFNDEANGGEDAKLVDENANEWNPRDGERAMVECVKSPV